MFEPNVKVRSRNQGKSPTNKKGMYMKLSIILLASSVVLISGNAMAAADGEMQTMQQCSTLLPQGASEYTVKINGKIDAKREYHGEFVVNSTTTQAPTPAEKKKLQPFVDCVSKLIN